MRRTFVIAGAAILAAIVAAVLLVYGTDVEGLRAAIRATARTSALCAGLAFARVRVRELSVLLPVSQTLHYVLVLLSGRDPDAAAIAVGVAVYAVMIWNAVRPNAVALWILWIAFLIGIGTNRGASLLYIAMTALLLSAGVVRWLTRPARPAPPRSPANASDAARDPSSTRARA